MLRLSSSRLSTSLARHSTSATTGVRTYATADIISTSEPEPLPPSTPGLDSSRPRRRRLQPDSAATKSSRQTVIVETSRPIQNMVEGFALLRALEQRFGPAQEFQFPRDMYNPKSFLPSFAVDFHTEANVVAGGQTMEVAVPARQTPETSIEEIMNGGPGLEALRAYLQPAYRENVATTGAALPPTDVTQPLQDGRPVEDAASVGASSVPPPDSIASSSAETVVVTPVEGTTPPPPTASKGKPKRVPEARTEIIELRLQVSPTPYQYRVRRGTMIAEQARRNIGTSFIQWGGFAQTKRPAPDSDAPPYPPRLQAAFTRLRSQLGSAAFAAAEAQRFPQPAALKPQPASAPAPDVVMQGRPTEQPASAEWMLPLRPVAEEAQVEKDNKAVSDAWANFTYPSDTNAPASPIAEPAPLDAPEPAEPAATVATPTPAESMAEKARRLAAKQVAAKVVTRSAAADASAAASAVAAPAAATTAAPLEPKPRRKPRGPRQDPATSEKEPEKAGVVTRFRDFFGV